MVSSLCFNSVLTHSCIIGATAARQNNRAVNTNTFTVCLHLLCDSGHLGMGCSLYSSVVMEMQSAGRLKSLSLYLFCLPRPAALWNRQTIMRTSQLLYRVHFFTSLLNFPSEFRRERDWMQAFSVSVCVYARVCLCCLLSLPCLFLDLTDCSVKSDLTEV